MIGDDNLKCEKCNGSGTLFIASYVDDEGNGYDPDPEPCDECDGTGKVLVDVKKIVTKYLMENGFDGLYNDWTGCGCEVSDLCPCESENFLSCKPGMRVPCPDDCGCGGFHIHNRIEE